MNVRVMWMLVALSALPLAAAAADATKADEPKLSCLSNFTFSQDFLHRHPKAGAACREVVMKDGQKWARFEARLVEVKGEKVTVDFIDSANRHVETMTFDAPADARVIVNGQPMTYRALGKGDPLSFWLPESRAGFYAQPGATKLAEVGVGRIEHD